MKPGCRTNVGAHERGYFVFFNLCGGGGGGVSWEQFSQQITELKLANLS